MKNEISGFCLRLEMAAPLLHALLGVALQLADALLVGGRSYTFQLQGILMIMVALPWLYGRRRSRNVSAFVLLGLLQSLALLISAVAISSDAIILGKILAVLAVLSTCVNGGVLIALWLRGPALDVAYSAQGPALAEIFETRPAGQDVTLGEISSRQPIALVFLRHSGCTFCRQHLLELSQEIGHLRDRGIAVGIVGMSDAQALRELAEKFELGDVFIFSDPECRLYRAIGMRRAGLPQLFGVPELSAMFGRGLLFKHGAGWVEGDAFQLHGCAVLQNRAILSVRAARRMSESCSIAPMLGGAS